MSLTSTDILEDVAIYFTKYLSGFIYNIEEYIFFMFKLFYLAGGMQANKASGIQDLDIPVCQEYNTIPRHELLLSWRKKFSN